MKTKLFLLIISSQILSISGQSYHNLLSIGYGYANADGSPMKNQISQIYLRASLPLKMKNGDYLLINPDIHKQSFKFNDNESKLCGKLGSGFAYMHMRKNGNIIALLNLSNNAELGHASLHSMQYGAGILVNRKINSNLKLKFGLYSNREFFSLLVVPLLGLDYKINQKFRLFGIMPQNLKLEYKASPYYRCGLAFEAPLNTYRLAKSNYLDQRQIVLGIFQEIYIGKNLAVQINVKLPLSNKQSQFANSQVYDLNIWGEGINGNRSVNNSPISSFKHGILLDCNLNYRLELE